MRPIRPSMLAKRSASLREKRMGVARSKPIVRVEDLLTALDRMHDRISVLEAANAQLQIRLNAYH